MSLALAPRLPLYRQWAAMPYSACHCMSQVRICTSRGSPLGPTTVVCNERYMLLLGLAM
ncbi:MAG: hypothetical protein BWY88_01330 [Synergistetes bacterium ADurb.Bin520]|nr:MAG: hypothetical protein BWY88_01330 [Synergistetes bacterium ADurb.Bin520]